MSMTASTSRGGLQCCFLISWYALMMLAELVFPRSKDRSICLLFLITLFALRSQNFDNGGCFRGAGHSKGSRNNRFLIITMYNRFQDWGTP